MINNTMTVEDIMLLVFMKLRVNVPNRFLSYLFSVSTSKVSSILWAYIREIA